MKRLEIIMPVRLALNARLHVYDGIGYTAIIHSGAIEIAGIGDTPEAALESALEHGRKRGFAPEIDAESLKRFRAELDAQRSEP